MLSNEVISDLANQLDEAEKARQQMRQLTLQHPELTIDDAYAVQRAWMDIKINQGRRVVGHKIGLTSRVMQQAVQINEPDHGVLLDDMIIENCTDIEIDRFIVPRLEVELAFILDKALSGPNCALTDVLDATRYVIPALEIIDVRFQMIDPETGRFKKIEDNIADNAANAGLILGGRPIKPMEVDLRWVSALLYKNGGVEESGVAASVLNHPANGIAWLANKIAPFGEGLEAGQIVLAGSFIRPVEINRGDNFHADFGALGSISCRFV